MAKIQPIIRNNGEILSQIKFGKQNWIGNEWTILCWSTQPRRQVPRELGMQPHPLPKFFGAKLIRFGQIWLDLGKI